MAFPIITLLLAAIVAFFAFSTGSMDTGMSEAAPPAATEAPASAPDAEAPVEE